MVKMMIFGLLEKNIELPNISVFMLQILHAVSKYPLLVKSRNDNTLNQMIINKKKTILIN